MGDRANIVMVYDNDEKIYLYTHWGGYRLATDLQHALIRGESRWDDDSYLARIIFSEMIQGEVLEETGYGISPYMCDNEHPLIYVTPKKQEVSIGQGSWSFEEFVGLDLDGIWE